MNKAPTVLSILAVSIIVFMVAFLIMGKKDNDEIAEKGVEVIDNNKDAAQKEEISDASETSTAGDSGEKDVSQKPRIAKDTRLNVPFIVQAPFGNWKDALFEDACEEAAILMATGWIEGREYTSQQAYDEIKKIASLEDKILKEHIDTSVDDTVRIMKEYSKHEDIMVTHDISVDDIITQISDGNLVVVPTNGKKLGNPFYTSPGPVTHMIVIIGYDSIKKEFITNDSGTRHGKDYRYGEEVLFEAIREYPTGNHYKKSIVESNPKKTMIAVRKNFKSL